MSKVPGYVDLARLERENRLAMEEQFLREMKRRWRGVAIRFGVAVGLAAGVIYLLAVILWGSL